MADFSLKFDQHKLAKLLLSRNEKFKPMIEKQFKLSLFEFVGYIQKQWYSSRHGDDTGLNRISGQLARGWSKIVKWEGIDLHGRIVNFQAPYGIYHDESYKKSNRKMPIRTFVVKDFLNPKIGAAMIVKGIQIALKEYSK